MLTLPTTPYPTIRQAILLLVLLVLCQICLAMPVGMVEVVFGVPLIQHPAVLALVNLVAFGLVLTWGYPRVGAPWSTVFPLRPVKPALFLPMALTIVGLQVVLSELDNLLRVFFPPPQVLADFFGDVIGARAGVWEPILLLIVVAPLTEEFIFRGLMLRGFLLQYSVRKSILISAVLFAVFHLNPWQFMGGLLLGLFLAWWFTRTRSLLPCLFGHALINGLPLILMAIPGLHIPGYNVEEADVVVFQPLWFDLGGFVCLGAGVYFTAGMFRKTVPVVRPV